VTTSTAVAALIDTNVLVYRFDARFPEKQDTATTILREGIRSEEIRLPHQAVVEFVSAVTRPLRDARPLLTLVEATEEAEALLVQFDVLYPDEETIRLALRGAATYQLSWFDAHMWAYAEQFGLETLLSEDFQHGRTYGAVRVVNPFREAGPA
jgi:predicted nucleic acid-binding protein